MIRFSIMIFLFFSFLTANSQAWKRERMEVSGGLGVANFLGDLGGSSSEGGNYGPQDLDFSASRYVINGSFRYYLRPNMAARASLSYAKLAGDDADSKNETRKDRGLKFRAPIIEVAAIYEFYFLSERTKGMYRLRGSKGLKKLKMDGYLFVGLGLFYFNPKGQAEDGSWHAVQPLGTEGQTAGNGSKYSRIQGTVPLGIGFKKKIDRKLSLGLEFGVRMTTTDYIDDVSDTYYEQDKIKAANGSDGDLAAYLANPNENNGWPSVTYNQDDGSVSEYQQRGDPTNNDTYMFATLSISYKLRRKRRSMPKF
jgi:hypothetical protein